MAFFNRLVDWPRLSTLRLFRANKVAQGSLLLFLATLLTSGVNFLLMPLWTRLMSPSEYGAFGTIQSYLGIIEAIAILGLNGALVRFYHGNANDPVQCLRSLQSSILGALSFGGMIYIIILLFLFFLLKPNQNGLEFWPYVPVALIGSIFGLIITLYRSWCLARQKHLSAVFMSLVLFVLVTTISLIFVAYLHWGAFGRIAGVATGTAVISIVLAFGPLRSVAIPKWDWQVLRPMLAFGIPIIPHSFAMVVVATSDRILIERFVGLQEAGRYTVAYTFTGILAMLIQSINSSWTPRYYTERNSKKGDVVIRRYIRLWTAVFALILPLFAWCGPPVFRLMAGPSYASFSNLLAPLAVGVFFMGTYQFSINSLFYAKKSLVVPIVSGIAAIMSVLLNILFIPHWGAQAAAYNSVASYAGLTVLAWWLSRKENPQADQLRTDFLWFIAIALVTLVPWSIFDLIVSAGLYLFWCGLVIYAFRTQLLTLGTHTHPPP